jgi:hypothetical protein
MSSVAYINPHRKYEINYDGCCTIMMHILQAEPLTASQKYGTESFACQCGSNGNQSVMIIVQIGKDNTVKLPFNVPQFQAFPHSVFNHPRSIICVT